MIICEICKKEYKFISHSHLKIHNKNEKEYLLMFPNASFYDNETLKNISENTKNAMKRPDVIVNVRSGLIKRSSNQNWKNKLSISTKRQHLNKEFRDKFYSKESNIKRSIAKKQWHIQHPEFAKQFVSQIYKNRILKHGYEIFKEQCKSASYLGFLANINKHGYNKFETKLYLMLKEASIEFIPQFKLYNRFYDAFLPKYNLLLEFDGDFYHKNSINECIYIFQKKNFKNDIIKNKLAKKNKYGLIRIKESDLKSINNIYTYIMEKL